MIKLAFVLKYCSDQSQTERHKKTTAKSPTIYAHLSLLLLLLTALGLVASATISHRDVSIFMMLPLSLQSISYVMTCPQKLERGLPQSLS